MIAKPAAAILLAACLVSAVSGMRLMRGAGPSAAESKGRARGSPDAKLSIVEYFDYQCGACRNVYLLMKEYERAYPGSIRVEMRYYPLPGHRFGLQAAIAADCAAAQEKFWPYHDRLMDRQADWSKLQDAAPAFRAYAEESGLSLASFDACSADPETEIRVLREKEAGTNLGVKLTPTTVVNGEFVVGSNAIREKLAKELGRVDSHVENSSHP